MFAVLLFNQAFKLEVKSRHTALLLLLLAGLLLRLLGAFSGDLNTWDEQFHALVAKHLLLHPLKPTLYESPILPYSIRNWTVNHVWLHKQPVALWLIALSIKIFGLHAWAVRLPSVLLSTVSIWLVYQTATSLYNRQVAFFTAFLYSFQGFVIQLVCGRAATDHIDAIFLFFIILCMYFVTRQMKRLNWSNTLLVGGVVGIAILTKWMPALIVLPLWGIIHWDAKQWKLHVLHFALLIAVALVVFMPWQVYIWQTFPQEAAWEARFNMLHFIYPLEGHEGKTLFHFKRMLYIYGFLVAIPLVAFAIRAYKTRTKADWVVIVWFALVYVVFSIAATKMPAYTIIATPAILMMYARGYLYLRELAGSRKWLRVVAVLLILFPAGYTCEWLLHKPSVPPLAVGDWNARTVVYNCPQYIRVMFYTDATAYAQDIDPAMRQKLEGQGYQLVDYSTFSARNQSRNSSFAR